MTVLLEVTTWAIRFPRRAVTIDLIIRETVKLRHTAISLASQLIGQCEK